MARQTVDYFPPTAEQKARELQAFIDSINPNDVCSLASQYKFLKPCRIFQKTPNGSYNICFFVEFEHYVKWVVRIPSESSVYNIWDKVQSEVTTIRYLKANTTIPVPHIHAFGRGGCVNNNNPTGHTFIIQDYVPGQSLNMSAFRKEPKERRKHFYVQLIDILAQLRQQEFHQVGSLMPDPNGGNTPLYHLLSQNYSLPAAKMSQEVAQLEIFGLEDLKGRLFSYINQHQNHGPFVLTHADLRWSNIIVNGDYQIQGVIDWEWSGTVPQQFFLPPTWLASFPPDWVSELQYKIEYRLFFDALKAATSQPSRQLAKEWGRTLPAQIDLPMAVILRHHSCFVNMYYRGIFPRFYNCTRDDAVKQSFERDGKDGPSH
ncbi:kinase-like domain-containing protein [Rhexocercosporidium sp. MPI-PUGE-AT-0058]|nr:kinase-like domain-containing protein [Rhexocercosporidium sp. MPI-PUGE-AT-0058]